MKRRVIFKLLSILGVVVFLSVCFAGCRKPVQNSKPTTITVTDMAGRVVEIPKEVNKVLCTSPPTTMLVYMLAPDKLGGWNFKPRGKYIKTVYKNLPVVGGWFGKQSGNYETFMKMQPDIILEGFTNQGNVAVSSLNERQKKMGNIPVVGIKETVNVEGYRDAIEFVGKLLGVEGQAKDLLSFYKRVLNKVKSVVSNTPEEERVRVYYAEGPKGLQTDPKGSFHSSLIELCGGINVAECPIKKGYGRTEVSIEQVILWDPDIIITGDPEFYKEVYADPKWKSIKAVRTGKVYLYPHNPFSWFDRPPGINRIIGIPWTAKILYPDKFSSLDLKSYVKKFYLKFYHYPLTDKEVNSILHKSELKGIKQ